MISTVLSSLLSRNFLIKLQSEDLIEKEAFKTNGGKFTACFHLDLASTCKASTQLVDTGIYFTTQRRKPAKVQLPVKLMKIHYNSMQDVAKASTLDQMGSLSHQIALVFDNGNLAYMLNPNHLKATAVYPSNQGCLQNDKDAKEKEVQDCPATFDAKPTKKTGKTFDELPYLCLTLEKNRPFVALRLYPDIKGIQNSGNEQHDRDWSSCIAELQNELTLWLSSLTDMSLDTLSKKRKRCNPSDGERKINGTSQSLYNANLESSFPQSSYNRPQISSSGIANSHESLHSKSQNTNSLSEFHDGALEEAVCLIDDMHYRLLSFLRHQQHLQKQDILASNRKKLAQDYIVYPSLEKLSELVSKAEMKDNITGKMPSLSDFTELAHRIVDLGLESPFHLREKVDELFF